MASLDLDFMEYSTSELARAAYVSNAAGTYLNTGGTITTDGLYTVHKFLLADSGASFTPVKAGNVEVLVVAGGGGGGGSSGSGNESGGGGGGGYQANASLSVTAQDYTITVGDGGLGGTGQNPGSNGANSVFSSITATGGGGGGHGIGGNGVDGGSGGGAGQASGTYGNASQGYHGGAGVSSGGGGGGGAGAVGATGGNGVGTGGVGLANDILVDGNNAYYAGGGAGANFWTNNVAGGNGGGGNSPSALNAASDPGDSNTGGGGGASRCNNGTVIGGKGGSGIVIIRCLTSDFLSTPALQSYSEATIKTQGSYSLKVVASITDSLNKTLTRTATIGDLTGVKNISFDIRSNRTGSNIKIGLVDAGATTEITPNIITANTFQKVNWDISNVSDANKNAITAIIVTQVNADAETTFYIDNFKIEQIVPNLELEIDNMEYSTSELAQAAYVMDGYSSDRIPTMTSATEPSGVASASSILNASYPAWRAFNKTQGAQDCWVSANEPSVGTPQWLRYDFGAGVTKVIARYVVKNRDNAAGVNSPNTWIFIASNNGTDWTTLQTITNDTDNAQNSLRTFIFANTTAYRYYQINITVRNGSDDYVIINELTMHETVLQSYSEATIKTQGSYSLKAVAAITGSLNKTLTKTLSPTKNLSGIRTLRFDVRSNRTGSNIKIGIYEGANLRSEITPNIVSADTFQEVKWDISTIPDVEKDAIDKIVVTILNADADNTLYLDYFDTVAFNTGMDVFGII